MCGVSDLRDVRGMIDVFDLADVFDMFGACGFVLICLMRLVYGLCVTF